MKRSCRRLVVVAAIMAAAAAPSGRGNIEVMRTDTASFRALVETRCNRGDDWYLVPAGCVDICNVPIVARQRS
jgi:peptidylprolyl isomerase